MSDTKRKPLLSDQSIRETFMYGSLILDAEHGFMSGANYARHEYEDARAKDAELIQQMVDGVIGVYWMGPEASKKLMTELLATAAAAGFKPSDR
jgi:hypothetical protein